ncbi:unnamed protein product [Lepeophtheirus salmonis]|uniref:(salmon louse) hypothetical protein n=1 Tax=Lepeophtheirus salmonis TaxID=72036 RepID=A0A7R8D6G3_LEPSM|nr:unnamed protein product [Lepeophtheirus salmonis]CAF3015802.1 unnamed protein product [Lepeophtheirus salmonis]
MFKLKGYYIWMSIKANMCQAMSLVFLFRFFNDLETMTDIGVKTHFKKFCAPMSNKQWETLSAPSLTEQEFCPSWTVPSYHFFKVCLPRFNDSSIDKLKSQIVVSSSIEQIQINGDDLIKSVSSFGSYISSKFFVERFFNDLYAVWTLVLGAFLFTGVISFLWIIMLRFFAKVLIWASLILLVVLIATVLTLNAIKLVSSYRDYLLDLWSGQQGIAVFIFEIYNEERIYHKGKQEFAIMSCIVLKRRLFPWILRQTNTILFRTNERNVHFILHFVCDCIKEKYRHCQYFFCNTRFIITDLANLYLATHHKSMLLLILIRMIILKMGRKKGEEEDFQTVIRAISEAFFPKNLCSSKGIGYQKLSKPKYKTILSSILRHTSSPNLINLRERFVLSREGDSIGKIYGENLSLNASEMGRNDDIFLSEYKVPKSLIKRPPRSRYQSTSFFFLERHF